MTSYSNKLKKSCHKRILKQRPEIKHSFIYCCYYSNVCVKTSSAWKTMRLQKYNKQTSGLCQQCRSPLNLLRAGLLPHAWQIYGSPAWGLNLILNIIIVLIHIWPDALGVLVTKPSRGCRVQRTLLAGWEQTQRRNAQMQDWSHESGPKTECAACACSQSQTCGDVPGSATVGKLALAPDLTTSGLCLHKAAFLRLTW